MVRTQIQLTEEQAEGLRRLATAQGVSMAELVREGVDHVLEGDQRARAWEQALSVVGKYKDPAGEEAVAEDHDRYLDEAYFRWRRS
jgi:Arc/MetJ-type ribon-helix-helix transcriptional regulator